MKYKILTLPDKKLRQRSKEVLLVDKRIENIIKDMKVILDKSEEPKGIGLAAPQMGIPLRIILVRFGNKVFPFINPQIIETEGEDVEGFEGCLSVPKIYGYVKRPAVVTIKAITNLRLNKNSKPITSPGFETGEFQFDSLPSRVIQHEIDHLNGIVFVDRVMEQKSKLYKITGKDKKGKDIFKEVSLSL